MKSIWQIHDLKTNCHTLGEGSWQHSIVNFLRWKLCKTNNKYVLYMNVTNENFEPFYVEYVFVQSTHKRKFLNNVQIFKIVSFGKIVVLFIRLNIFKKHSLDYFIKFFTFHFNYKYTFPLTLLQWNCETSLHLLLNSLKISRN